MGYIVEALNLYISSIKNKIILLPFIWSLLLGIGLSIFKDLEYLSIVIVLVCSTTMDKGKYNILAIMPIKTKDIVKIPFISSYISTIIVHVILIVTAYARGENKVPLYLTILTVSLVIINFIISITFSSGMGVDEGCGVGLFTIVFLIIGLGVNYSIVVGLQNIIQYNLILTLIIDIMLVLLTLKYSYKWTLKNTLK